MKISLMNRSKSLIESYLLVNDNGMVAEIINYGARIDKLLVPNKEGNLINVLAGFDTPDGYRGDNPYFNAVIGRVANRIGNARFCLEGKEYTLFANDGKNHLHGGKEGFDRKLWSAEIIEGEQPKLKLSYSSPSGEEGYPNELKATVTYYLDNLNRLNIEYNAKADGTTLCSLTNHAYFNLEGNFDNVYSHELTIKASKVTAYDAELIPHGDTPSVLNTALDFTLPKAIGKDVFSSFELVKLAGGFDVNYILDKHNENEWVASCYSQASGVRMDVFTDRPCLQFYSGNFLDGLKGRKTYGKHSAFCLETQGYPNACNVPSFPSTVLKNGEVFNSFTRYAFSVE